MKLKRDKLFRRLEAHKEFMSPAERATHKRKRDARKKKKEKRIAGKTMAKAFTETVAEFGKATRKQYASNYGATRVFPDGRTEVIGSEPIDPEDLTLPLPAETMAEVSEGKLK